MPKLEQFPSALLDHSGMREYKSAISVGWGCAGEFFVCVFECRILISDCKVGRCWVPRLEDRKYLWIFVFHFCHSVGRKEIISKNPYKQRNLILTEIFQSGC